MLEISHSYYFSWYHGRLDRIGAEERLRQYRGADGTNMGSYLVRESDRKPGSYVLSYLGKTGINHFRVTAVCGDFYIGGRLNSLGAFLALQFKIDDSQGKSDQRRSSRDSLELQIRRF